MAGRSADAEAPQLERRRAGRACWPIRWPRSRARSRISSACRRSGPSTRDRWAEALGDAGLAHAADSGEFRNARRLFNLTVSRWPLRHLPAVGAPQPERVLSTVVETPGTACSSSTTSTSRRRRAAASSRSRRARRSTSGSPGPRDRHRVLCGDFNIAAPGDDRGRGDHLRREPSRAPRALGRGRALDHRGPGRMGPRRRLPATERLRPPRRELGLSHPCPAQGRPPARSRARLGEPRYRLLRLPPRLA